jgi:hypothetical protein
MAAVNEAYEKGDFEAIQRVLADWEASPDIGTGDGVVAELIRVIRRLSQVRTRLLEIEKTVETLRLTDIFVLFKQHEESKSRGEDLLAALVSQASRELSYAKRTLKKLKKEASKKLTKTRRNSFQKTHHLHLCQQAWLAVDYRLLDNLHNGRTRNLPTA